MANDNRYILTRLLSKNSFLEAMSAMIEKNSYESNWGQQNEEPDYSRAPSGSSTTDGRLLVLGILIVVVLTLMIFSSSSAQTESQGYTIATKVIKAEVLDVDLENRLLTFRGPNKIPIEVHVSEKIKNLNKIKVGDQVKIDYHASLAIYLGKPGSQPKEDLELVVERSDEGESPGGRALQTLDASALVRSIDKTNRTLTLELDGGDVVTTEVEDSSPTFDGLKVGDTIQVRLTKAVAFSLETPEP